MARNRPLEQRFWEQVDKTPTCWLWTGTTDKDGYGNISSSQYHVRRAHRASWCLAREQSIPLGMCVCHTCDNPPCVNPEHLFLGSNKDNMHDKIRKGRAYEGERVNTARLSAEIIREMRAWYAAGGWTQLEISAAFCISKAQGSKILARSSWRNL